MASRLSIFFDYLSISIRLTLLVREVLICLFAVLLLDGLLFSIVEGKDIGTSIYFAFITGLTVGYGDISPETTLGRILSVFMAICGTIVVGLVVAINTRALAITYQKQGEQLEAVALKSTEKKP